MTRFNRANKFSAQKTYSELCERKFDSKAEARRGEELALLQRAGEISDLQYQVSFKLCEKPSIKIKIDFVYAKDGVVIVEDSKGFMTREARVKIAWLKQLHGIDVKITK